MGRRSSHIADLDRGSRRCQPLLKLGVRIAGQLDGALYAQADHVGGLGGGVVNLLGEVNALLVSLAFTIHCGPPPGAFEPDDEADAHGNEIHHGQSGRQRMVLSHFKVEAGTRRDAHKVVDHGRGGDPGQDKPER